jgi:hypothetical protein
MYIVLHSIDVYIYTGTEVPIQLLSPRYVGHNRSLHPSRWGPSMPSWQRDPAIPELAFWSFGDGRMDQRISLATWGRYCVHPDSSINRNYIDDINRYGDVIWVSYIWGWYLSLSLILHTTYHSRNTGGMWAGSIRNPIYSFWDSKKWLLRRGLRPTSRGIRPNSEKTFWKTPGFWQKNDKSDKSHKTIRFRQMFDVLPSLPGAGSFRMPAPEYRNSGAVGRRSPPMAPSGFHRDGGAEVCTCSGDLVLRPVRLPLDHSHGKKYL